MSSLIGDFFGLKNLLMNLKTLIVSETGILRQC
jgi:hypothetical protein